MKTRIDLHQTVGKLVEITIAGPRDWRTLWLKRKRLVVFRGGITNVSNHVGQGIIVEVRDSTWLLSRRVGGTRHGR